MGILYKKAEPVKPLSACKCGGKAVRLQLSSMNPYYTIICDKCGNRVSEMTAQEADNKWEKINMILLQAGFYNMDCLEGMAQFPDKFFELAIVDPPYAVGASDGSFGNRGYDSKTSNLKHYANHDKTPNEDYFKELFRISKNWIVWGGNYYPQHFTHTGAIIWHKKTYNPLSDCEIAFQSFNKLVKYVYIPWAGFVKNGEKEDRMHPNQKPIGLYKWLLANYAHPGDKILDTHVGSASSLIACHQMGYEYWGFELDTDYFNAATERLEKVKSQVTLDELIPPKIEQTTF